MTSDHWSSWADFEAGAPAIAATGRDILYQSGEGAGLLATVRADALPRIHPVNVGVVDGHLYTFLHHSAKQRDLDADGRYALHGYLDPARPGEISIRGRVRHVLPGPEWDRAASDWSFPVDESYLLYELGVTSAILGERGADEWPPRYTRWTANAP